MRATSGAVARTKASCSGKRATRADRWTAALSRLSAQLLPAAIAQGITGVAVWMSLLGLACYCGVICRRGGDSNAAPLLAALMAMLISLQFWPLTLTNELYQLALSALLVALAARCVALEPRKLVVS